MIFKVKNKGSELDSISHIHSGKIWQELSSLMGHIFFKFSKNGIPDDFINTLAHREFMSSFPSRLVIEKEKVIIENWNKPYIPGIINPDNFYTHPKNPIILEVFKQIGRADELGSGVRNVFKYGKLYGKSDPIFKEGDIFSTIISILGIYVLIV